MSRTEVDQQQPNREPVGNLIRLPKKITPTPVVEAIAEIRFTSTFPADAIFGVVYNEFKSTYTTIEKLPILQIPEAVRTQDPAFLFQPYYRLKKDNFLLSIGAKVLSVVVQQPYPGWEVYLAEIQEVFTKANSLGFIEKITRAAIRYVDFFADDIFKNINLQILLGDQVAPTEEAYFRTVLKSRDFMSLLQIANNARLETLGQQQVGSLIDLDTFRVNDLDNFFEHVEDYLNQAHLAQKEIFFSLLKPEFLARLNPEY